MTDLERLEIAVKERDKLWKLYKLSLELLMRALRLQVLRERLIK